MFVATKISGLPSTVVDMVVNPSVKEPLRDSGISHDVVGILTVTALVDSVKSWTAQVAMPFTPAGLVTVVRTSTGENLKASTLVNVTGLSFPSAERTVVETFASTVPITSVDKEQEVVATTAVDSEAVIWILQDASTGLPAGSRTVTTVMTAANVGTLVLVTVIAMPEKTVEEVIELKVPLMFSGI